VAARAQNSRDAHKSRLNVHYFLFSFFFPSRSLVLRSLSYERARAHSLRVLGNCERRINYYSSIGRAASDTLDTLVENLAKVPRKARLGRKMK